jgi:hypothetical protein
MATWKWKVTNTAPPGMRSITIQTPDGSTTLEVPPLIAGRRLARGQSSFFPTSIWANFMTVIKAYEKGGVVTIEKVCQHNNRFDSCSECEKTERKNLDPFFGPISSNAKRLFANSKES